jgi:hypothetical protein
MQPGYSLANRTAQSAGATSENSLSLLCDLTERATGVARLHAAGVWLAFFEPTTLQLNWALLVVATWAFERNAMVWQSLYRGTRSFVRPPWSLFEDEHGKREAWHNAVPSSWTGLV